GIIHADKIAIIGDPLFPAVIIDEISNRTEAVYLADKQFKHLDQDLDWTWSNDNCGPWHLEHLSFPISNASAAIQAWTLLFNEEPLSEGFLRDALYNIHLSGRFEVVKEEPLVILDVAHNPQAFRAQLGLLKRNKCIGKTHFVLGMLQDKNAKACIDEVKSMVDFWYLCDLDTDRSIAADNLKSLVNDGESSSKVIGCYSSPLEAYSAATENVQTIDRIIVTGSFYTVAPILKKFQLSQ
ncbi:MAG: dihydrofolate synthase/folylpolyglutamate synthase, partial [Enterobacterales bacterium]